MAETVAYLTKRFPRLSETFILDEILGLEAAGVPLRLYAIADPHEKLVQPDVLRVASPVVYLQTAGSGMERWREYRGTMVAHVRLFRESPRRYLGVVTYIARRRRHLSTLKNFAQAGRLAQILRKNETRHLHAAFAHGPASVAHFVHLLTGIPYSFSAHAKDIYVSAPDLLARKLRDASFVLSCSESARNALTALAGADVAKVILANHGVDTRRFTLQERADSPEGSESPLRVLAVGRLVAKKGYPVLLEALKIMGDAERLVRCTIVGAGTDRDQLVALTAELGLTGSVEFVGSQTHQEVAERFHHADVFVQASVVLANGDRDGIPNSLLEAMASGLAVVASDVAGIPEVVTPECGLLVAPGDSTLLAAGLVRLADDAVLRSQLGARAREHVVEKFDRTACALRIAPLFGISTEVHPVGKSETSARSSTTYSTNREG
ncbi:MAG: glycosyltransferase family 4 protein [Acidimicrobiaceae bacterium]|nr:glycosyltransferase family 4 protein [Acidimicrobiaceae bacterium]